MKTKLIPANCSAEGCKRTAVTATLSPLRCWVSRCERHEGKEITLNLNQCEQDRAGKERGDGK